MLQQLLAELQQPPVVETDPEKEAERQERLARKHCAILLLRESARQAALARKWRTQRLQAAHHMTQMCAWGHQVSAAFLLAHSELTGA